ncbi:MAG: metal-dependent hydrolase, partial [Candidatus Thorarchaeota archaeon]
SVVYVELQAASRIVAGGLCSFWIQNPFMPSPVAHTAIGYMIYQLSKSRLPQEGSKRVGPFSRSLVVTVGLSLLPDMDAVLGLLMGDLARFHNNVTNSLIVGLLVAPVVGGIAWMRQRSGFTRWLFIALLSYELHVMMDYLSVGRGLMLLWPLSWERYESPVKLFYGFRWSQPLMSVHHVWTLATELGFSAIIVLAAHIITRRAISLPSRQSPMP